MRSHVTIIDENKTSRVTGWNGPPQFSVKMEHSFKGCLHFAGLFGLHCCFRGKTTVKFRIIRGVVKQSSDHLKSQNWNGIYNIAVTFGMQLVWAKTQVFTAVRILVLTRYVFKSTIIKIYLNEMWDSVTLEIFHSRVCTAVHLKFPYLCTFALPSLKSIRYISLQSKGRKYSALS